MKRLTKIATRALFAFLLFIPGGAAFEAAPPVAEKIRISSTGYTLIKRFEGFSSEAYPDAITGGAPWAYGYGFIRKESGDPVAPGDRIHKSKAEHRLRHEAELECGEIIRRIHKAHLTQNRVDAAASFCWNIGGARFSNSIFFRKWSLGDIEGAAKSLMNWVAAGTSVEPVLRKRRALEQHVFRAKGPVLVGNLH